jgi:3-deoxy-D-manno-octulosonic-acid transferase
MFFLSLLLYRIGLWLYQCGIHVAAIAGNQKAKEWVEGREEILLKTAALMKGKPRSIWFHCASLGEFEQGRPLIELVRKQIPDAFIVLTFFSPSGYNQRKNYAEADEVLYLPTDSPANARKFIFALKPKAAFFIKYEFWYYYFKELNAQSVPLFMVSSVFTGSQPFFKFYGAVHRSILKYVSHFFVQDENSVSMLRRLGFENTTQIPDTRIDRVHQQAQMNISIPSIEAFLKGEKAFIGGSIYRKENGMIYAARQKGLIGGKIILVPHNIDKENINAIRAVWQDEAILYTDFLTAGSVTEKEVLILDTIGLLSALYKYGSIAFIGGGFGDGIHNTLEPAAFGLPIIAGPDHAKFPEVAAIIKSGGTFEVKGQKEMEEALTILSNPNQLTNAGEQNARFIKENTGGTEMVWNFVRGSL